MTFSFELYPPRSEEAAQALAETVRRLTEVGPEFISVTYGASGSSRGASFDLLRELRQHTSVLPLAHLTTVGSSRDELRGLVRELLDAQIYDFLALRGDPPAGTNEADLDVSQLLPSAELVRLIREERERYSATRGEPVFGKTAVAAYPNGHERSLDRSSDIAFLIDKQEAGADFAITQLFFFADDYLDFVSDARDAGLTIPVLPGLMPVSTAKQLRRVAELAGQEPPDDLLARLEGSGGSAPELGVEHTVHLARELLAGGAPSIHLYTFNKYESVLAVLRELGMLAR